MTDQIPLPGPTIDLARAPARAELLFSYLPDPDQRRDIAAALDLTSLKKARLDGRLVPDGATDWRLEASLGATAVQACSVTLEPVTTRIDEPVVRRYVAEPAVIVEGEMEMPDDETEEELPKLIDLDAVFREALALAVPDYPRAPGAEIGTIAVTEPGKVAMSDDDARPFAGLKALRASRTGSQDGSENE